MTAWVLAVLLSASENPASLEYGREVHQRFWSGDLRSLWDSSEAAFRRDIPSVAAFKAHRARVLRDFGEEVRLVAESLGQRGDAIVYTRSVVGTRYARGIDFEWVYDASGFLLGLSVRRATREAPTPHMGVMPVTRLRLPVDGTWFVLWGGSTWTDNRHASVSDQRFAVDLLMWAGKSSFSGKGTANEDYPCFGKPVVAPADGTVVVAEDGLVDNVPGAPSVKRLYGNFVVIKHGPSEYSLLAHLRRGSLVVKKGDFVQQSQAIAFVGNSGTSTEPHLHYQLMDGPDWKRAHGRPAIFDGYFANDEFIERGEPRRGQSLRHAL